MSEHAAADRRRKLVRRLIVAECIARRGEGPLALRGGRRGMPARGTAPEATPPGRAGGRQ